MEWYRATLEEVEKRLATDSHVGLSDNESKSRLSTYGYNRLPEIKADSLFTIFIRQFQSPLIYILIVASAIVFYIGDIADALIIIFVLIFNAVVGTLQEGKAQNTLEALREFTHTTANVLRNGREKVIPEEEVVSGDVLVLEEGEKVSADARIIESNSLRVDESALTGESGPIEKTASVILEINSYPAEAENMVFKGTGVLRGSGRAVVVATGVDSFIGKISVAVASIDTEIPLKRDIRILSRVILAVVLAISVGLFFVGVFLGKTPAEMFATVVSLAVSVIPEGLPIVLTLVLASGVWRMAKRNALVKRLQAVEALGQAKVIAVDKTGTLTKNELVLRKVFVDRNMFEIGGVGYETKGEVKFNGQVVDPPSHSDLILCAKVATYASTANVVEIEDQSASDKKVLEDAPKTWKVIGDPTEAAMTVFGEKIGFRKEELEQEFPLVADIPFEYETKYHLTVHREKKNQFIALAGAPEVITVLAGKVFSGGKLVEFDSRRKLDMEAVFNEMSSNGLRVLALAFAEIAGEGLKLPLDPKADVKGIAFLGLIGIEDSLRPEVPLAMERAREADIRVVMITGDHKLTALAIAKEAGIWKDGSKVITGIDLNKMSEDELSRELADTAVFARVTPEHKMKIINGYRKRGEVVAMTGDGVNDAPSLVAADLGVAMGKIGTEVAKEAADIVLLDDNFGTIVSAVEEGRSMYKTIKKVILYLFSTSAGEVITIAGAVMMSYPLPILAPQILWLNLVTDGFLNIALAMESNEKELLREKFTKSKRRLVDNLMFQRIVVMAIPMGLGSLFLFSYFYQDNLLKAQTLTLTTLAIFQWFNAWNCRSENKSIFSSNPLSNKFLVGALAIVVFLQILAVYNPLMQKILRTVPLTVNEWGLAVVLSLSVILAEEARKFLYKSFSKV